MRRRAILVPLLCGLLLALFVAARLSAHGIGKPQVVNERVGPYLISVWTDPDPLRADETHVVVGVTNPDTREPVVGGIEVTVALVSAADPAVVVTQTAGTDSVNQLLYAAEFNDRVAAGRWRVVITVTGAQGPVEAPGFDVDIDPARGFGMLRLGLGGLAAIVAVWFLGSIRDESPARARRKRPAPKPR